MRGKEYLVGLTLGCLLVAGLFWLRRPVEQQRQHPPRPPATSTQRPAPAEPPAPTPVSVAPQPEKPALPEAVAPDPASPVPAAEPLQDPPPSPALTAGVSLAGTVSTGEQPLAQVELLLLLPSKDKKPPQEAAPLRSTSSDALGQYRFDGLEPAQRLILALRAPGYLAQQHELHLPMEGELLRDVSLVAGLRLSGWVRDTRELGLAGMRVQVTSKSGGGSSTISQEDGSFALAGAHEGTVYLRVSDPEGVYHSLDWQSASAGSEGVILYMERAGSLSGRVSDPQGRPVVGAEVGLRGAKEYLAQRRVRTDTLGIFRFAGMGTAEHTVTVAAAGYAEHNEAGVATRAGEDTWLDLELARGATLRGIAIDPQGAPVPGVAVVRISSTVQSWGAKGDGFIEQQVRALLEAADGEEAPALEERDGLIGVLLTTTAEDGRFALPGLGDGMHRILAVSRDYVTERADVHVDGGQDPRPLTFELQPGGSVAGTILDEAGQPVAGARVTVDQGSGQLAAARADEQGSYRVTRLASGQYTVTAFDITGPQKNQRSVSERVVVVFGQETDLDLQFRAGVEVLGRVVEAGQPLPGLSLSFRLDAGDALVRSATTDELGRFRIAHLEPGAYQVWLHPEGRKDLTVLSAQVPAGSPQVQLPDLVVPLTRLTGTVRELASNERLSKVGVGLVSAEAQALVGSSAFSELIENLAGFTLTGPEGEFELNGMDGGRYLLRVQHEGYLPWVQELTLQEGGELLGLRVDLDRGVSLQGQVRNPEGAPLPAAVVGRCLDAGDAYTVTGAAGLDGSYVLAGLMPGRQYAIWAAWRGYAPARVVLQIPAEGGELDLALGEPCTLRIRVTHLGQPVADARVLLRFPDGGWLDEAAGPGLPAHPQTTAANGILEMNDLLAGSYTVEVSTDGGQLQKQVVVEPREATLLELRIEEAD